jgi:CubicO group peptidase (beta-lactamase class C family)
MEYAELVQKRICDPLQMGSPTVRLTPEMWARLAVGHNASLKPANNWDSGPAFEGAGALRSDVEILAASAPGIDNGTPTCY